MRGANGLLISGLHKRLEWITDTVYYWSEYNNALSSRFDQTERSILLAIYEVRMERTPHTLWPPSSSERPVGTPPAGVAFAETRDATERLIVRGLVRGERLRGADGVHSPFKTQSQGEKTAIQQRTVAAEEAKALEEAVERSGEMAAKIQKHSDEEKKP